jgi:predicted ferric reductase
MRVKSVNVRRDANALEFFVHNRRREDVMLVEEITADRRRLDSFDIHIRDRTRLIRIERRVETDFGTSFKRFIQ